MTTASTGTSSPLAIRTESVIKAGAIAGLVAAVANVVVFFIAKAAGVPFEVTLGSTTTTVMFLQPLFASFIAIMLGALVLQGMLRLRSGVTIWTALASVFFVAYTAYAFSAAEDTSTGVVLTIMHLVALSAAFGLVLPVARRRAVA